MASSISRNGGGRFRAINGQKRPANEPTPCPSNLPGVRHTEANRRGRPPRANRESMGFGHGIPTSPRARMAFSHRSQSAHQGVARDKNDERTYKTRRQSFAAPRRVSNTTSMQNRTQQNWGDHWRSKQAYRRVSQPGGPSGSERRVEHGTKRCITEPSPMLVETPRPPPRETAGKQGLVDPPTTLSRPQKMNILRVLLDVKDRIMETCTEHGALKYQCPCYWAAMAELVAERVGWRFDPMVLKRKFTGDGLGASQKPLGNSKDEWYDAVQEWRSALAHNPEAGMMIPKPAPSSSEALNSETLHGAMSLFPATREDAHRRLEEHLNAMLDPDATPDDRGRSSVIVGAVLAGNRSRFTPKHAERFATGLVGWLAESSPDRTIVMQQSSVSHSNDNEVCYRQGPAQLTSSSSRDTHGTGSLAPGNIAPKSPNRTEMAGPSQTFGDATASLVEGISPEHSQRIEDTSSQLSPSKRKPAHDSPRAPSPKKLRLGHRAEQAGQCQEALQDLAQLSTARPSNPTGGRSQQAWRKANKRKYLQQSFELTQDPSTPLRPAEGSSRSDAPNNADRQDRRLLDSHAWRGGERATPRHSHGEPQAIKGIQGAPHGSPSSHAVCPVSSSGGAGQRRSVTGQESLAEVAMALPPPQALNKGPGIAKTPGLDAWAGFPGPQHRQRAQTQPPSEIEMRYQYHELQKEMSELRTGLKATNYDISRIKKDQEAEKRKTQPGETSKGDDKDDDTAGGDGETEAGHEDAKKEKRQKKKKNKKKKQKAIKTESE